MWLAFSFQGEAIPTISTLGRQTTGRDSQSSALSKLTLVVNKLLDSSLTASTSSSYTHAWSTSRNFAEKYSLRTDIPVQQHILVLYVAFIFSKDYALSTITSYLSAISHVHKLNGLKDPCSSFVVQKVLTGARKLKPTTDVRMPITILHKLLDSLQYTISNLYENILFRAMFC